MRLTPATALNWRAGAVLAPVLAAILAAGCGTFGSYSAPPRDAVLPVVAVSSFDNRSGFEGQWHLGNGMADLLVSELLQSRHFVVVERQQFEQLTAEIGRQHGQMFRPEGRVAPGRMKGAKFLVRGVIADFSQTGGGGLWMTVKNLFLLGRGYNARVALTLTLVDIESGQIISSVQSIGLVRAREAYAEGRYKGVSFGGDAFFRTPLGRATASAIRSGVRQIIREMPPDFWRPMIADVRGRMLVLNGGTDRSFRVGDELVVRTPAQPVTDPATGDVLSFLPGPQVGRIRIVQVAERIAFAEPMSGSGFQRGQWLIRPEVAQPPQ
jgi:curli biogenesis system outer membrane secretion channel CsgG